jgi:hypothetical protein
MGLVFPYGQAQPYNTNACLTYCNFGSHQTLAGIFSFPVVPKDSLAAVSRAPVDATLTL